MVEDLSMLVTSKRGRFRFQQVAHEFDYASGRTDLVGRDGEDRLHAFETKLIKWKEALDQARRNACFAHFCYVALPFRSAQSALRAKSEFRRHGVGLVLMTGLDAKLAIRPRKQAPLLPWLTKMALAFFPTNERVA